MVTLRKQNLEKTNKTTTHRSSNNFDNNKVLLSLVSSFTWNGLVISVGLVKDLNRLVVCWYSFMQTVRDTTLVFRSLSTSTVLNKIWRDCKKSKHFKTFFKATAKKEAYCKLLSYEGSFDCRLLLIRIRFFTISILLTYLPLLLDQSRNLTLFSFQNTPNTISKAVDFIIIFVVWLALHHCEALYTKD